MSSGTWASARAVALHYETVGPEDAPPVLFLHGLTASRRYWIPRVFPLAAGRRLLVPDLPGFGLSPKPLADYTPAFFAEALLGLLDRERNTEKFSIVGHSLGAILALELLRRAPGRVDRLVLSSLPRFFDPEDAHQTLVAGSSKYRKLVAMDSLGADLGQFRRTGWALTARYLRRLPWAAIADTRRFTYRSLTSTLEHCLMHHDLDPIFPELTRVPTLLLHGDLDQVAPISRVIELPFRHPFPVLQVLRGAGHHPLHTHLPLTLRVIRHHLDGKPPAVRGGDLETYLVLPPRGAFPHEGSAILEG
jgi:pimeloyl-ACP methyl ester carboxylesterase